MENNVDTGKKPGSNGVLYKTDSPICIEQLQRDVTPNQLTKNQKNV